MRVLFVNVPSRAGHSLVPLGSLYAAGAVIRAGHHATIYDLYKGSVGGLLREVKAYRPEVIAYSGIATSYGRTKFLAHLLRTYGAIQIAGGPLACTHEYLLRNAEIDFVFHGEGERSLPTFLNAGCGTSGTPGVSFIGDDGVIHRNPPAPQVENLDDIPIPPYDLIRPETYPGDFPVLTSRGCTHRCLFCYRHMLSYRQHSPRYVRDHLRHLLEGYGITFFNIGDELFNRSKEWVMGFCDAIKGLGITYVVAGARVTPMDDEMLQRLRDTGCQSIAYGQESGSEAILQGYRKGVTVAQNREVTLRTRAHGIKCPVQLVIGGPQETPGTIAETARFLHSVHGGEQVSVNYLMPFPGTPVWPEARWRIPDVEKYLDEVMRFGGAPLVNLTGSPDRLWKTWALKLKTEGRIATGELTGPYATLLRGFAHLYELVPGGPVRWLREFREEVMRG